MCAEYYIWFCLAVHSNIHPHRELMNLDVYQVVPGAGWSLEDLTLWMCPTNGATCTAPRLVATYFL